MIDDDEDTNESTATNDFSIARLEIAQPVLRSSNYSIFIIYNLFMFMYSIFKAPKTKRRGRDSTLIDEVPDEKQPKQSSFITITIMKKNDSFGFDFESNTVSKIVESGPAAKTILRVGDTISKISGKSVGQLSKESILTKLSEMKTQVSLTVVRDQPNKETEPAVTQMEFLIKSLESAATSNGHDSSESKSKITKIKSKSKSNWDLI